MLTVSLYIAKKLYKPTGGSKIQTALQLIVSLLYAIVSIGAGLAITYLVEIVQARVYYRSHKEANQHNHQFHALSIWFDPFSFNFNDWYT